MKLLTNMTTSFHDLPRYTDHADLEKFYKDLGLDGLELMEGGPDEKGIVHSDDVIGIHLQYQHDWVGFWNNDMNYMLREYGSEAMVEKILGGLSRKGLVESYRKNLDFARSYSPEYAVFHVSNETLGQSVTGETPWKDEEVIEAVIELCNEVFDDRADDFALLFENLWWTGLAMTRPELTLRLLEGVKHKNKGVMLDVGHLLNTNTKLRSPDEACDYIESVLDLYDDISFIKGIHLHMSLSGEYVEKIRANPFVPSGDDYLEKIFSLQSHIIQIDTHKPFTTRRVNGFLDRIKPEYLVLELISGDRDEHARYIREQLGYLN
jgi:sugar phosphate isomerase/epimerase